MDDVIILEVLQKATTAAVTGSDMPTLPIKFIGRSFIVPDDQKWLEVVFLPNNRAGYWGNEKDYRGTYRLLLHWPNNNEGAYEPMRVLASIARFFSKDTPLSGVTISDNPDTTGVIENGAENLFPVSIRYQSFRQ